MVVKQKEKDLIEAIRVLNKARKVMNNDYNELEDYVNKLFNELIENNETGG